MAWTYEYTSTRLGVHFKKGDRFICKGPAYKSAYSGSSLGYNYTNDPTEKQFWGYYSASGSIPYPIHFADTSGARQYYIADSSIGSNVSGTPIYYFDLNFIINGTSTNNTSIAKADVYIGGSKVASGVGDYYKQHLKGSSYEIKNIIVASGYTRYKTPTLKGTLNAKTAINIYIGKNYTYSFNANGGSGAPSAATKTYGVSFTFPSTKPTRTGYTFTGWSNSSVNNGKVYSAGTQYSDLPNGNYTFYANWKANSYTITYKANGGSGSDQTQTATYGTSWTTKGAIYTKTGYTQTSWNTKSDGSGTKYSLNTGQTSAQLSNVTLYAIYTANTYSVKYNANGGSGSMSNSSHTYNKAKALTANTFSRTGYSFKNWNTKSDGSGTSYADKASVTNLTSTNGGTVNLYAQWTINSYTLTIEPNGGTWNSSTSNATFTQNYNTTKALPLPTRAGYFFIGWQDLGTGWTYDSNNDNICFENGVGNITTYCNAGDGSVSITREAMSTPTGSGYGLKIHFNSSAQTNWGWGFVDLEQSEANATFIHAFQAKVPKGYTLQYAYNACGDGATRRWLTSNEGMGDWATYAYETKCGSTGSFGTFGYVYLTGGSVPVTWYLASSNIYKSTGSTFYYSSGNGSLKAIWAPNRYTITYNANGGYSTPNTTSTSQIITYDETFTFKGREYTKPGYAHIGWNTKADGSGTKYGLSASTTYATVGNLTLYAQWRAATANEQKIYLYNNGYCEALGFAKTSDWYGFKKGVVGAKDFTIGTPASSKSKTMQFKGMIVKNLT